MSERKFDERKFVSFSLRVGLAIVFLYAGISALLNPTSWIGFIPSWLRDIVSPKLFLPVHAVADILIGLWLMSGQKKIYASLLAGLSFFLIVIFNVGALDIIFRDVALLFSAIALIILHFNEVNEK